jgi:hypothetical protein
MICSAIPSALSPIAARAELTRLLERDAVCLRVSVGACGAAFGRQQESKPE